MGLLDNNFWILFAYVILVACNFLETFLETPFNLNRLPNVNQPEFTETFDIAMK